MYGFLRVNSEKQVELYLSYARLPFVYADRYIFNFK